MSEGDERLTEMLRGVAADAEHNAPRFDTTGIISEADSRRSRWWILAPGRRGAGRPVGARPRGPLVPRLAIAGFLVALVVAGILVRVTQSSNRDAQPASPGVSTTTHSIGTTSTSLPGPSTTIGTTTGATGATTTSSTSSTTTTVPPVRPCTTSEVSLSVVTGSGAAGTLATEWAVHDAGTVACTITGYPAITLYGPVNSGGSTTEQTLPVQVVPATSFANLNGGGGTITIPAGGSANFAFVWTDVTQPGGCRNWNAFGFATPASGAGDEIRVSLGGGSPSLVCGPTMKILGMFPASLKLS